MLIGHSGLRSRFLIKQNESRDASFSQRVADRDMTLAKAPSLPPGAGALAARRAADAVRWAADAVWWPAGRTIR